MATFELVEKLRQHANVTYDEAKSALEACGDDLLEALIYLERQGKVAPPAGGGSYSSKDMPRDEPFAPKSQANAQSGETFGQLLKRFLRWCGKLLRKGNRNHFDVWRKDEIILSLPVTILVLLLLCCFCVTFPLLVIGLFCGYRYAFRGAEVESTGMNNIMDSVADTAGNIKSDVINAHHNHQNMYHEQARNTNDSQNGTPQP